MPRTKKVKIEDAPIKDTMNLSEQEYQEKLLELERKRELLQSKYDGALELIASLKETITYQNETITFHKKKPKRSTKK